MINKLKEMNTKKKMRTFEDEVWDAEWEQVLENRKNNPNRQNEKATKQQKEAIYKKLKGEK